MAIDINLLRKEKGGNPDLVKESQQKRYKSTELIDEVIDLDKQFTAKQYEVSQLKAKMNATTKQFAAAKKSNDAEKQTELQNQIKDIKQLIATDEAIETELSTKRAQQLTKIGNILRPEVPVSETEDDNVVRCHFDGKNGKRGKCLTHIDLFQKLSGSDCIRGQKCAGSRAYYLSGFGALLNSAVIAYAQQFLAKRSYIIMQTPFFMEKDMMGKAAELADFDEQLYKVSGEGNDKYLIATSEQTLCAYFSGEVVDFAKYNKQYTNYRKYLAKPIPREEDAEGDYFHKKQSIENPTFNTNNTVMFAGYSTCFRKEAGKHGKDMLGIFRVHQFEKIEQLIITQPQYSDELHYYLINTAREFYESLNIPYRVVEIVSSAFNDAAARKFDLEGWFPGSQCYRELVSCSNCTDYQARNLDIKYLDKGEKKYCHLLNSTLCATERFLCCLVENWCDEEGFNVPEPLRPYMEGVEKFYFEN